MSCTPPQGGPLFVEALEARIAPTGLTGLANNPNDPVSTSDPRYVTYTTAPVDGVKLGFVPASSYGVNPAAGAAPVYAIKLNGNANSGQLGDQLLIFNPTTGFNPAAPFLQSTDKNVVAFFQDLDRDNQVDSNELVGLSLAKKASVNVNGNVNGGIVTNLAKDGNSIPNLNTVGNFKTTISNVTITGTVTGKVLIGGSLNNTQINGNADAVLLGTAASGSAYSFGGAGVVTGTIGGVATKPFTAGPSVTNLVLLSVNDRVEAGAGGVGASGGILTGVTIQSDIDGFTLRGGLGGDGVGTVKAGAGGAVSNVTINGALDVTPAGQNHALITIVGGTGGNNTTGKAGNGGALSNVFVNADSFNPVTLESQISGTLLDDNVLVGGGQGGTGFKGAAGGAASNVTVYGSVSAVDNPTGASEIQVLGGNGGAGMDMGGRPGKGGAGGLVNNVLAQNLDITAEALQSRIFVHGGDAGLGKTGGSVSNVTLLGSQLIVTGGNGRTNNADGSGNEVVSLKSGGSGGSVTNVIVQDRSNIVATSLTVRGGDGGSSIRAGGTGGSVTGVTMSNGDLATLAIVGGIGGAGLDTLGGSGGSLSNITITEGGTPRAITASFNLAAGNGGGGQTNGGAGGALTNIQVFGNDFAYTVVSGNGGAGNTGDGGAGGDFNTVGVSNQPALTLNNFGLTTSTGSITAGDGGPGGLAAGKGGDLGGVNARTVGDVSLRAGNGGNGGLGSGGVGGNVTASAGLAVLGRVSVTAGNAGPAGNTAVAGGSITNFLAAGAGGLSVAASGNQPGISMTAGNGGSGGDGGSIVNSGTSLNQFASAPQFGIVTAISSGDVRITAGNGSLRGAGGNIVNFNGFIGVGGTLPDGTQVTGRTILTAGNGGGEVRNTGTGGSITGVKLTGESNLGGGNQQIVTLDAGNGGTFIQNGVNATKKGGSGGSVSNVALFNLDAGTTIHHIAAGDGVSGTKKGGSGGNVDQINVGTANDGEPNRIGVLAGRAYGLDVNTQAGGIFAGVGGVGNTAARTGSAGSVTNITATAIASIAAGRDAGLAGSRVQLANTVDAIYLNGGPGGLAIIVANADGSVVNAATANYVGSFQGDPTAAGTTTYRTGDGLIAAVNLTENRDFSPEAYLRLNPSGATPYLLVDLRQPDLNNPVTVPVG